LKDKARINTGAGLAGQCRRAESQGFRPGVMERIGLGPEVVLGQPRDFFGLLPHDRAGVRMPVGRRRRPRYQIYLGERAMAGDRDKERNPFRRLNWSAIYGGGALLFRGRVPRALLEASRRQGQVVDARCAHGADS